jgi:hypothetical protein
MIKDSAEWGIWSKHVDNGNLYKCILKACFPNMSNLEFGPFNRNKIQKCFYGSSITH